MTSGTAVLTKEKVKEWNHVTARSVGEIMEWLSGVWRIGGWLFRGEASVEWNGLEPMADRAFVRSDPRGVPWIAREVDMINNFVRDARVLLNDVEREMVDTDALSACAVLKQHGGPSRLLDWSESAYVAAFFASCERRDRDGVVWAISRNALNDYSMAHRIQDVKMVHGRLDGGGWCNVMDASRKGVGEVHINGWVAGVRLSRMVRQQSAFTVANGLGVSHFDVLTRELHRGHRSAILIPAGMKAEVVRRLSAMNLTFFSLFPDLYGVARHAELEAGVQERVNLDEGTAGVLLPKYPDALAKERVPVEWREIGRVIPGPHVQAGTVVAPVFAEQEKK